MPRNSIAEHTAPRTKPKTPHNFVAEREISRSKPRVSVSWHPGTSRTPGHSPPSPSASRRKTQTRAAAYKTHSTPKPASKTKSWRDNIPAWALEVGRVALNSLAHSTQLNYRSAWRTFCTFCNTHKINRALRFPADELVLCAFAASQAGKAAGGSVANQMAALKTWHALYNAPWSGSARLAYVLKGVGNSAPSSSRRAPHPPITSQMLRHLHNSLDLSRPRDAAVFAVATTMFWGQCRIGEVLATSRQNTSNPSLPTIASLSKTSSANGSRELHLPKTKTNQKNGQTVVLTRQEREVDALRAIAILLQANDKQPKDSNLFTFREGPMGTLKALTKESFLTRCNEIWSQLGYQRVTGHCFRIGGTTELLQEGTPVDLVKSMGRWRSDAFQRYWRGLGAIASKHVEFLQERNTDTPRIASQRVRGRSGRQAVPT